MYFIARLCTHSNIVMSLISFGLHTVVENSRAIVNGLRQSKVVSLLLHN